MKPLFTLHAGEIVAGEYIERKYKNVELWVPTKDTGIDLLATGKYSRKVLSFQIKYSKHFPSGLNDAELEKGLRACGWWTLNRQKIKESHADYWIFVLRRFEGSKFDFVVMPPGELLKRLDAIYPKKLNTCHTYIWVTVDDQCWATRGLGKADQSLIAQGKFTNCQEERDFGNFLNVWNPVEKLNGLQQFKLD